MGQTVLGAVASGVALAGVLAVAGAAAARLGWAMPHLGVGALGPAAALVAGRLSAAQPRPLAAIGLLGTAAAAGLLGWAVEHGVRRRTAGFWPPELTADVGVLGVAIAIGWALRSPTSVDLPLGVLGGLTTSGWAAAAAAAVGFPTAVVLGLRGVSVRHPALVWLVAATGAAVTVAVGAGLLPLGAQPPVPAFGVPDAVGIALRAVAVAAIGRRGLPWLLGAAIVLGLAEALVRAVWSTGELVLVVYLLILVQSLVGVHRTSPSAA